MKNMDIHQDRRYGSPIVEGNFPSVTPLSIAPLNLGCFAINLGTRTVAIVTPQGYVDWLLISPHDPGRLIREIYRETHLAYVLGLKMNLHLPQLCEQMTGLRHEISEDGKSLRLVGDSRSGDGLWAGRHEALLAVNPADGRYEWSFHTQLTCRSEKPLKPDWIEYNNVLPGKVGRCMLFAPEKEFDCTLMTDRDGVAWKFPHQHTMLYSRKIKQLHFSEGSLAGFFGEALNPVVRVETSTLEPDWAICDMFYDLHCGSRVTAPIEPGQELHWRYCVKYLDSQASKPYLRKAKLIPLEAEDYRKHDCPRLALGRNSFDRAVAIDDLEDADYFRTNPPVKVWDRQAGPRNSGALRLMNDQPIETVWSAEPPNQIPASTRFQLRALMKTENVVGKGLFLRLRYHAFQWQPTPHVEWFPVIESQPVSGTTDWVHVETPELKVPEAIPDHFLWIDFVLDGQGTGWLADVEVDLRHIYSEAPVSSTPVKV